MNIAMQTREPVTTEAARLDAWYAAQTANNSVRDIKFSLSAEGKDATVESLAREVNLTLALSKTESFQRFYSAKELNDHLRSKRS